MLHFTPCVLQKDPYIPTSCLLCAYGGANDEDMDKHNPHTATKLKMISLYDLMLHPFKYIGCCVVMDSTYMGDVMAQVGREFWKINMVGTVESNRTSGGSLGVAAIEQKEIQESTILWARLTHLRPRQCRIGMYIPHDP